MIIHQSHPESGFVIVPNAMIRDPRLSYAARGLLAELLSRPDDWHETADRVWQRGRHERGPAADGRRIILGIFAELEAAGYMSRVRRRAHRGRFVTELHVFDTPVDNQAASLLLTDISAGHTGNHTGGMPVPPAETRKRAGRTDIPPTDRSVDGQSVDRHAGERQVYKKTGTEDHLPKTGDKDASVVEDDRHPVVLNSAVQVEGSRNGPVKISFDTRTRAGTDAERRRQDELLDDWIRQHPDGTP